MESEAIVMGTVSLGDVALSFLLILLEALITFFLAYSFAPLKRPKQAWWVLLLNALFVCLEANIVSWSGTVGIIVHAFFLQMVYASVACYLFECRLLKALALSLLVSVYSSAGDTLCMSVLFFFFSAEEQEAQPFIAYCFSFAAKFLEFGGVLLLYRRRKRSQSRCDPDMTGWLLVLLFSIPGYLLEVSLSRTLWYDLDAVRVGLVTSTLLIFVCVGVFFLLDYSGRRQEEVLENTALRQNLKLETAHIESMTSRYTQQRAQTHDFKNQLAVLRDMARRNVPQAEFSAYLDSMLEIDIPSVLYINTHRTVVDIVMSEKVPVAKEKGIDFQFQLDDLTDFPMPDDALVVVLTNLIDNAIEACGKIPQAAERHIWMRMKVEKRSALMCIDNTTAEPVAIRDNTVQTTKEDTLAHGYGLKNVAAMIERSGGMYFIEYDAADKKFRFTASLPMKTE